MARTDAEPTDIARHALAGEGAVADAAQNGLEAAHDSRSSTTGSASSGDPRAGQRHERMGACQRQLLAACGAQQTGDATINKAGVP
jgi:hypothetical protein